MLRRQKISQALFLIVLFLTPLFCPAQNAAPSPTDSIQVKRESGYYYLQGGKELSAAKLHALLQTNEKAAERLKAAKSEQTLATILGYAGGFLIGWPIGTAIAGGKPSWELAGVGAGLVVVAIPFARSGNKQLRKAVDLYNTQVKTPSATFFKEARLGLTSNGVGLVLRW